MVSTKDLDHEWAFARLDRYLDGDLEDEETEGVETHVATCVICQRRLAELRAVERAYAGERLGSSVEGPSPEYRDQLLERLAGDRGTRRYDPVTVDDLEALAAFHSDTYPVVSLYLDLRAQKWQDTKELLKHLLEEGERKLADAPSEWRKNLQAEAERITCWFETEYDRTGRGLAIFVSSELGLWTAFRLPVPVRDQIIVADRPYLRPLLALADEYERFLVMLVDKQTARLFVVYMGEIEEYTELMDELVPHPKAGGPSAEKFQRHHDMRVLWHVKHAIEVAERLWAQERCEWLVIGGTQEPLAELREHLPKALAEKLAGEVTVSLKARPDEILEEVLEVERANEERVEAQRVDALLTAALGNGPGVLGLDDTLLSIVEPTIMVLVVNEDFHQPGFECPNCGNLLAHPEERCPLCGAVLDAQVDIVERAVQRASEQGATVEVLRSGARVALGAHGQIGALLRYRVAPADT